MKYFQKYDNMVFPIIISVLRYMYVLQVIKLQIKQ